MNEYSTFLQDAKLPDAKQASKIAHARVSSTIDDAKFKQLDLEVQKVNEPP
jgi:hypothetical protein